jgi:uncharacterized protein (TIGR02217 family)
MRVPRGAWRFVGACAVEVNVTILIPPFRGGMKNPQMAAILIDPRPASRKSLDTLSAVVAFFEERRGRLYGFRWRDRLDHSYSAAGAEPEPADQLIGLGDGTRTEFQLMKTYGSLHAPYARPIAKPVAGSVRIAVDGIEAEAGTDFDIDPVTGLVIFGPGQAPADLAPVTAGFQFDVPARFDSDFLEVDLAAFAAGEIPSIPIVEIRP